MGFSIVKHGYSGIQWLRIVRIVASWFVSPVLAGAISAFLFILIRRFILKSANPLESGKLRNTVLSCLWPFGTKQLSRKLAQQTTIAGSTYCKIYNGLAKKPLRARSSVGACWCMKQSLWRNKPFYKYEEQFLSIGIFCASGMSRIYHMLFFAIFSMVFGFVCSSQTFKCRQNALLMVVRHRNSGSKISWSSIGWRKCVGPVCDNRWVGCWMPNVFTGLRALPIFYGTTIFINLISIFLGGAVKIPWWAGLIVSVGIPLIVGLAVWRWLVPWKRRTVVSNVRRLRATTVVPIMCAMNCKPTAFSLVNTVYCSPALIILLF